MDQFSLTFAQTSFLIRQLSLSRRDEGEAVGMMHCQFPVVEWEEPHFRGLGPTGS